MRLYAGAAVAALGNEHGIDVVDYFGPIGQKDGMLLAHKMRNALGAVPLIERIDRALFVPSDEYVADDLSAQLDTPPAAIICRVSDYEQVKLMCEKLAQVGIVRAAFVDERLALEWVHSMATV